MTAVGESLDRPRSASENGDVVDGKPSEQRNDDRAKAKEFRARLLATIAEQWPMVATGLSNGQSARAEIERVRATQADDLMLARSDACDAGRTELLALLEDLAALEQL